MTTRQEHDAFDPMEIEAGRCYGAQTRRALDMFGGGQECLPASLIHAAGLQKLAAVRANVTVGAIDPALAGAIEQAAREM